MGHLTNPPRLRVYHITFKNKIEKIFKENVEGITILTHKYYTINKVLFYLRGTTYKNDDIKK